MKTFRAIPLVPFVLFAFAFPAASHELWIAPSEYQVSSDAPVVVNLRNGQGFEGIDLAWFDKRILRFDRLQNGTVTPLEGRSGDIPAARIQAAGDGLIVLVYESAPSTLTYSEWEKFTEFAKHKDLDGTLESHAARALPQTGFKEVYSRYSKALIGAGQAKGQDRAFGLEIEFVALANPYTDPMDQGLPVQVNYRGKPRRDAQIEVFERAPTGAVAISTLRTDDSGQAAIPVKPGHEYLLDSVVMREPAPDLAKDKGAVWESLWAAMTFRVPG